MKIIYKVLLVVITMGSSLMLSAQSGNDVSTPVQQGTTLVVNGQATVNLNQGVTEGAASYYVYLVSVGTPMLLSIGEKGTQSFTIQATPAAGFSINGTADYIVFTSRHLQRVNTILAPGQKTPQPTAPPANGNR